ncbi:MAG: PAS domain S-box protein [Gammaproteobacteria bacterium]|nr:PAS domain S-box protein [Gammaproteobacteria bacterium]
MHQDERNNAELLVEIESLRERLAKLEAVDRKKSEAEQALLDSEEKYRNTMDAALVGIYVIQDLIFQYVNPTMAQLFGYLPEELQGVKSPIDLVVPEQREQVRQNLIHRAAGETGKPYEISCLRNNGTTFDGMVWGRAVTYRGQKASVGTLVDISTLKSAQKVLINHQAQLEEQVLEKTRELQQANAQLQRDIGARVRAEEALRQNEERLRSLINATEEDIVMLLDVDQHIQIANERAARGFGLTVPEILGRVLSDLLPAEVAAVREAKIKAVLTTGQPIQFEDQRGGLWFDSNMCPVFGPGGSPQAVAIFARDITRRKHMEGALARAKEEAEKASFAKSRFLAAANHDLRQPIQALSLLLSAFATKIIDETSARLVGDMATTVQIMKNLLNSLLDISKLEAGYFIPEKRNFHGLDFLHKLRTQFKVHAEEAGIRIRIFPSDAVLFTDEALLTRIIQNYISNAVRHSNGGKLLLCCRRSGNYRRIEVWDRGIGIPADQLEKIFEEFYQLGNPARDRHQGLGLGLAIARRIANLLGLRLDARSVPGKGSVFSVEVPIGSGFVDSERHLFADSISSPLSGAVRTVLLVEDDELVLNASSQLLMIWGFNVLCAQSAEEALELVARHREESLLAILDYRLPNGWNGVRLYSELQIIAGRPLPGILVTGDTAASQLREVKASGLPVLHKPVDSQELFRFIKLVIESQDKS